MNFRAYIKKFQSIEDGTLSVVLRVSEEDREAVMRLYKQDVIVELLPLSGEHEFDVDSGIVTVVELKELIVQQIGQLEEIKGKL